MNERPLEELLTVLQKVREVSFGYWFLTRKGEYFERDECRRVAEAALAEIKEEWEVTADELADLALADGTLLQRPIPVAFDGQVEVMTVAEALYQVLFEAAVDEGQDMSGTLDEVRDLITNEEEEGPRERERFEWFRDEWARLKQEGGCPQCGGFVAYYPKRDDTPAHLHCWGDFDTSGVGEVGLMEALLVAESSKCGWVQYWPKEEEE